MWWRDKLQTVNHCCLSTWAPTVVPGETWSISSTMITLFWGSSQHLRGTDGFLFNFSGEEEVLEEE